MRVFIILIISSLCLWGSLIAQSPIVSPTSGNARLHAGAHHNARTGTARTDSTAGYDPSLAPFYHGVASGDPLSDGVIIWTRVTPETQNDTTLDVFWAVATDTGMTNVIQSGTFTTDANRDYTVKVDVNGLNAGTTYYYEFETLDKKSLRGRTRTAPDGDVNQLRFVVVSCSNYEAGYFNAYGRIADRNDLDAILHLGDYIYEYPTGVYGDTSLIDRRHDTSETVTVDEYRARYSLYRLDSDLRRAHQQHPFVNIWDDHESANDAWQGGAENHTDSTEGDWNVRRSQARQAYFEWIPIREQTNDIIYRKLSYGDLVDLIMLDTRLAGRDSQINDVLNPALYAPTRTMLGQTQREWLLDQLNNSTAKWKVVGNQVIFAQLNVGWAAVAPQTPSDVESIFLDIWDGYPMERLSIINYLRDSAINNVVFVTGDFHSTFSFDIADTVTNDAAFYAPVPNYDGGTGNGSVAVEFTTPSISAANFDENLDPLTSAGLEFQFNNPFPSPAPPNNPNPHMKNVDLDQHGYMLLDLNADSAQGNWYYVDRLDSISAVEAFGAANYAKDGENHLNAGGIESAGKPVQEIPAPAMPRVIEDTTTSINQIAHLAILGIYPNPAQDQFVVQYALDQSRTVRMQLLDVQGRVVADLVNARQLPGVYHLRMDTRSLAEGVYVLRGQEGERIFARRVIIRR
ncbi:MAG: alkaline phosphatase D family protein [Bacteroidota bacterium]